MRRRDLLLAGFVVAAWPAASRAQSSGVPVIGFLSSRSPNESADLVAAFRKGLQQAGFVEGRNLAIEFRWAEGRYDRLPTLATELVGLRVAILVAAGGTPSALAAKDATSTIAVIFSGVNDPIGSGLVASLSRPGGNVTGMSVLNAALDAKRLELLREVAPSVSVVAYLVNPSNPSTLRNLQEMQAAAHGLRIQLHPLEASTEHELGAVTGTLEKLHAQAVIVPADPFFDSRRDILVALHARHMVAGIYPWREYVAAGGLMSYGPSLPDSYRQAGVYAARVLKGEKPGDLPVMQPTAFELTINIRTARALGLTVPATLLDRADEVIE
jgi:putative ABC transport system substrate-binding protein